MLSLYASCLVVEIVVISTRSIQLNLNEKNRPTFEDCVPYTKECECEPFGAEGACLEMSSSQKSLFKSVPPKNIGSIHRKKLNSAKKQSRQKISEGETVWRRIERHKRIFKGEFSQCTESFLRNVI